MLPIFVIGMITFNKKYFFLFILILLIEILIALYIKDKIIRPYIGDVLVVILVYCFVKSFLDLPVVTAAIAVLVFAFLVEFLQYIHIVDRLGLSKYKVAKVIIGTTFQWMDLVAYATGILFILLFELRLRKK